MVDATATSPSGAAAGAPPQSLRVAAVQMVSGASVDGNLREAERLIAGAAAQGARLVGLPEYFCLMGRSERDKIDIRETPGAGPIQSFLAAQARRHGIWLVGGTLPLAAPEAERVYNSTLVFDPQGAPVARYDKIHLFAFRQGAESYDESRSIAPGSRPARFAWRPGGGAPALRVGLSVCYDLRFPELYRQLAGVDLLVVPAAFTATTGRAHWETLLRARAIENLCYVLACAQGGRHENGRETFGRSMLVDPWGEVVARLESGPGIVLGEVSAERIAHCRASLPALEHRVLSS